MEKLNSQLLESIRKKDLPEVKSLLVQGAAVTATDVNGLTALIIAIQGYGYSSSSTSIAKALLQACKEIPVGTVPLCVVEPDVSRREQSDKYNCEVLEYLLKFGNINLSERGDDGATLLHNLVSIKHFRSAAILIQQGADLSLGDEKGRNAVHYLAKRGGYMENGEEWKWEEDEFTHQHWVLLRLMIKNGARLSSKDPAGATVTEMLEERLPTWMKLAKFLGREVVPVTF